MPASTACALSHDNVPEKKFTKMNEMQLQKHSPFPVPKHLPLKGT